MKETLTEKLRLRHNSLRVGIRIKLMYHYGIRVMQKRLVLVA